MEVYELHVFARAMAAKAVVLARADQACLQRTAETSNRLYMRGVCSFAFLDSINKQNHISMAHSDALLYHDKPVLLLHTSLLLLGCCCCSSRLLQLTAFTPNAVQDLSSVPTLLCLLTLYTMT